MSRIAALPEEQLVYFAACEIICRGLVGLGAPLQPVGDHFEILSGYAFKSATYVQEGVRLLRNINVRPDRIDWSAAAYLSAEDAKQYERFRLASGDLVMSMDGTINNQGIKIAFLTQTDVPALLLQRVCRFDPIGSIEKRFLFHVLHSEDFLDHVDRSNRSIAIPHVSAGQLKSFRIPTVEQDTQTLICDFLDSVKAGIAVCRWPTLPKGLAEQQQVVLRVAELISKIQEARELRCQATEHAKALVVSTHLRLAGSRTRKLAELITLDEREVQIAPSEKYPQVGVRSFGGGLFPKPAILGAETTYGTFNRLYDGAVVLSQVKGWEGAVAVCGSDLSGWFVSPEYRTFRCIPSEACPDYMAAVVRTEWFWKRLKNATRGVGARRERTRPEQFLALEIPMPDVQHQHAAEDIFSEVGRLKSLQAETSAELDALIPSILDKAFRGEL
jgi:hypothetical protein